MKGSDTIDIDDLTLSAGGCPATQGNDAESYYAGMKLNFIYDLYKAFGFLNPFPYKL